MSRPLVKRTRTQSSASKAGHPLVGFPPSRRIKRQHLSHHPGQPSVPDAPAGARRACSIPITHNITPPARYYCAQHSSNLLPVYRRPHLSMSLHSLCVAPCPSANQRNHRRARAPSDLAAHCRDQLRVAGSQRRRLRHSCRASPVGKAVQHNRERRRSGRQRSDHVRDRGSISGSAFTKARG